MPNPYATKINAILDAAGSIDADEMARRLQGYSTDDLIVVLSSRLLVVENTGGGGSGGGALAYQSVTFAWNTSGIQTNDGAHAFTIPEGSILVDVKLNTEVQFDGTSPRLAVGIPDHTDIVLGSSVDFVNDVQSNYQQPGADFFANGQIGGIAVGGDVDVRMYLQNNGDQPNPPNSTTGSGTLYYLIAEVS
jgi:hypothetical protein